MSYLPRNLDSIHRLFPDAADLADRATTVLMALGSMARPAVKSPGLLPCRIHNFFRGLPGLWVCMDAACTEVAKEERSGFCGKLYGQPHDRCKCGARIHQLYTCRFCGTAYARAYTDDVDNPTTIWSEPGQRLRMDDGETSPLLPLDMLLEQPNPAHANGLSSPGSGDAGGGRRRGNRPEP